jgi:hypothetical protein
MPNALAGYSSPDAANRNALADPWAEVPAYLRSYISSNFDPSQYRWDPQSMSLVSANGSLGFGDFADPSQGTNVVYPTGASEHFDPSSTPVTSFLNAGSNYASTGGIKSTNDPNLISQLNADQRTRANQAIVKEVAMGLGSAYGANTPWSTGATGYGTGTATATDVAFGATPAASIGAEGVGATVGGVGGGIAGGTAAGTGGGMGLGLADWLNIGSTVVGAAGANRAANIESDASNAATAEQARQYDLARSDLAPYREAGVKALGELSDPNANFLASPDYAFRRSEGMRDIGGSFAARGGAFSGNALKALADYNSNLASGEFGNWWNRKAGVAGVGQAATNSGNTLGAYYANNAGQNMLSGANARASGIQNAAGILAGGANNFATNYLYRQKYPGPYSPYVGYGG